MSWKQNSSIDDGSPLLHSLSSFGKTLKRHNVCVTTSKMINAQNLELSWNLVWYVFKKIFYGILAFRPMSVAGITEHGWTLMSRIGWGVKRCRTVCTRWQCLRVHSVTSQLHSCYGNVFMLTRRNFQPQLYNWSQVGRLMPPHSSQAALTYLMARSWTELSLNGRTWWI